MLINLKTEMLRRKLTARAIAKDIGISERAMSNKVTETTEFTRSQMCTIHDKYFHDTDMRWLFASDNEKA